jgi:hypothetical protein
MDRRPQPKTANEMQQMRKGRNLALLAVICGLVLLFYVLTLVKIGTGS